MNLEQLITKCSTPCDYRYRVGVFLQGHPNKSVGFANFDCSSIELTHKNGYSLLELHEPHHLLFVFYITEAAVKECSAPDTGYEICFDNITIHVECSPIINE